MSVSRIFDSSRRALATNQAGLSTTSHNISNVNTKGYSRQRVELKSDIPDSIGVHQVGRGVRLAGITRANNQFIDRRIEQETSALGELEGSADIYKQVEGLFNGDAERGIGEAVNRFFNEIRTLSTQPDAQPLRTAVRDSAAAVASRFQEFSENMTTLAGDVSRRIEGNVDEVNRLTQHIAKLNQQITETEMGGAPRNANDARDQRDLAMKDLAKLIPVKAIETENGSVTVMGDGIGVLVSGQDSVGMVATRAADDRFGTTTRIMIRDSSGKPNRDITEQISSGALGGLVRMGSRDLKQVVGKIDQLAFGLAKNVNQIHREAFGRDGMSGRDFFAEPDQVLGAAGALKLDSALERNVASLATADLPNASGDNRALLRIADLQDAKVFEGGDSNFTDYMSSVIGSVGIEVRKVNDGLVGQQDMVQQLSGFREELVGVSLDEEAIDMIKFQKAFDANAKMIQVADSMLETVINLKRF